MGALVLLEARHGHGRQPAQIEAIRDARDELTALIVEGQDLGTALVTIARAAQIRLARGQSPATALDELERIGLRHIARMRAAAAAANASAPCPDGEVTRHAGHGRAA